MRALEGREKSENMTRKKEEKLHGFDIEGIQFIRAKVVNDKQEKKMYQNIQ